MENEAESRRDSGRRPTQSAATVSTPAIAPALLGFTSSPHPDSLFGIERVFLVCFNPRHISPVFSVPC